MKKWAILGIVAMMALAPVTVTFQQGAETPPPTPDRSLKAETPPPTPDSNGKLA